ncbi:MAG: hypothetical protein ACK5AZ_26880 [Bryobacteraceae bacterium]
MLNGNGQHAVAFSGATDPQHPHSILLHIPTRFYADSLSRVLSVSAYSHPTQGGEITLVGYLVKR